MLNSSNQWTNGRSATKFCYTYEDIATLSGLTKETVRKYASKGKFNPKDLASTLDFINTYRFTAKIAEIK